jgi:hypothetical protein
LLPDPPKLLPFTGPLSPTGQPISLSTFSQKAEALAAKFFPNPLADLSDIDDTTFAAQYDPPPKFEVDRYIIPIDIAEALGKIGP